MNEMYTESHRVIERANKQEEGLAAFISTITPDNPTQNYFVDNFLRRLQSMGIIPIRVVSSIYDKKNPIDKVRETINQCKFMIILGLERTHSYYLRDKEGTIKEKEEIHRRYTSGWLHLEAGIGNALGLPIFVLCEKNIFSDGIFDRDWNTYLVVELETLDVDSDQLNEFFEHLEDKINSL